MRSRTTRQIHALPRPAPARVDRTAARDAVHDAIFEWADDEEFSDVNIEHGCLADVIVDSLRERRML